MPNIVASSRSSSLIGSADLTVTQDWGSGFTGLVTIANSGVVATDGWEVEIDTTDDLTALWNGALVSSGAGKYILSSAAWNAQIAAGGSTTLGFNFDQSSDTAPISVSLIQLGSATALSPPPTAPTTPAQTAPSSTATLAVTTDWGSGFTGQVTVTNTSATAISSWEVEVDSPGNMTGNWNSTLVSNANGVYLLSSADWNGVLAPGASTTLGFNMDRASGSSPVAVTVAQVNGSSTTGSSTTGGGTTTGGSGSTPTTPPPVTPPSSTFTVPTQQAGQFQYLGVNLSGAEFGNPDPADGSYIIGTDGVNYTYPTHAEVDYYASEGLNVIRLPFTWERLQPVEGGALDTTQLGYIDDIVHYAATKGMSVILDPHDFGYGYGNLIGSSGTSDATFAGFWGQLAAHFVDQPNVIFGLMNEPHVQSASDWVAPVNDAISAIRAAGATQEILVPGTDWTGGSSWITSGNAQVFAPQVNDPLHNMAFEIHQYSDSDGSGSSTAVVSTTIAEERLQAVTNWAAQTGNKLFLGEFGSGADPASIANLTNMLTYMQQNTNVWQGGTEWGGGPWWGSYGFATDPVNGVTTNQVSTLAAFAPKHAT